MRKIYLGKVDTASVILQVLHDTGLNKVAVIGNAVALPNDIVADGTTYTESIMYRNYYRLLQFIGHDTLFVWNNAFVSTNRYLLNYNCIRKYAQQTPYRLVFQELPVKESVNDFMVLWDMIQPNPFLKESFSDVKRFDNVDVIGFSLPEINAEQVAITPEQHKKYLQVKEDAILAVKKNADIIPNRCLKYAETIASKNAKKHFDSKAVIMPKMQVSITPLPVDNYFYNNLQNIVKETENALQKIY